MPAPTDFRLYHSNSLDVLADLLAAELRTPAPGQALLAPDTVLIPQVAMRRWLQAHLAQTHGVAANLEFLTPGEFVRRALNANVAGADEDLDATGLHWRLYAAFHDPAVLREPALRPLRAYLSGTVLSGDVLVGNDPLKPWSLAGELAAVFEKYQAWRRDWLLGWEAGAGRDDPQAVLWRHLARHTRHRARRIDDYLARFNRADAPAPAGLPPRLFAFATLSVSPDVLRVIATQARAGTLHFYLPTPTRKYWGDLATLGERLRAGETAAFGEDENPLLQAWGAAGRDFMAVLGGYEVVHPSGEIAAYAEPKSGWRKSAPNAADETLLQRLQRDLLDRQPLPSTPWRTTVDKRDPSLQIHACHTRLREVQVLHDQLRALLEDPRFDPPLQPREIAVLAPDIDPYAPYIEAVFGGLSGRSDNIPYALADASPLAAEPLAEVFLQLLALPISRFGFSEVLDLLATPALSEQAQLDTTALERLRVWLFEAGARWGLDAAHRSRLDAPRDDACTWAFALDRLLLGHASDDETPIAGVAPHPPLEGSALDALDALIRLLRVLARHERLFANAMTPAQWRERLLGLLEALLPERPRAAQDQRTLERLRVVLDTFATTAAQAGFEQTVPPEVVRAHFHSVLGEADTRAPLLTGGVSFGRMVPLRLLPFRVIALLGMNDGEVPRRDPAGTLNQLTAELGTSARRYGDRSLRDDDRFLFLQLFAAAEDVFYLSYLGADPRDGSAREPSVLIAELLDAASRYHLDHEAARQHLIVAHPLQPFAPAAFGSEAEPRRFSYRNEWRPAANASGSARHALPAWLDAPLSPPVEAAVVTLTELRQFLTDPPRAFLRQRLALRLPFEAARTEDIEPLMLPQRGWSRTQLQQVVFDACVRGDTTDLHARLRAQAWLPSGPLGARQLTRLLDEVQPYADAFVQWRGDGIAQSQIIDLDLDGVRLQGRIEQLYPAGLARFRFDELHGPAQIAHGLDWLASAAQGEARPLAQFAHTRSGVGPHLRAPAAPAQARAALRELLTLRAWGLRDPLPFMPRSGWVWYEAEAQLRDGAPVRANARSPWQKAFERWHGDGWNESRSAGVQLALRGRDPFADENIGESFRAIATTVFDAVVAGEA